MKRLLIVAAIAIIPGGLVVAGIWQAHRLVQRRRARREVRAEMARMGAPMPRVEVRA